jgi:hypothetical protein
MAIFRSIHTGPPTCPEEPELDLTAYAAALVHLKKAEKLLLSVRRCLGYKGNGDLPDQHDWRIDEKAREAINLVDAMQFNCQQEIEQWGKVIAFKKAHPEQPS